MLPICERHPAGGQQRHPVSVLAAPRLPAPARRPHRTPSHASTLPTCFALALPHTCQVLQADGGTRCAAINAAVLALAVAGIPLRDLVSAVAAGHLDATPLLDLNALEDAGGGPDLAVALGPKTDTLLLVQMDNRLPVDTFQVRLGLGWRSQGTAPRVRRRMRRVLGLGTYEVVMSAGDVRRVG